MYQTLFASSSASGRLGPLYNFDTMVPSAPAPHTFGSGPTVVPDEPTETKLVVTLITPSSDGERRIRMEQKWPHGWVDRDALMEVCQDALRAAGYSWPESE